MHQSSNQYKSINKFLSAKINLVFCLSQMCDVDFLKDVKERIIMLEILQWNHDGRLNKVNTDRFISDVYIGEYTNEQSIKVLKALNYVYGDICRVSKNDKVKIYLEKSDSYGIGESEEDIKKTHDLLWNKLSFLKK
jgi:hypothetical protein